MLNSRDILDMTKVYDIPVIKIYVRGGVVEDVDLDGADVMYEIIDYDNIEAEEDDLLSVP